MTDHTERDEFERQARYQGITDFSLNQDGLRTYANDVAEMAWRVWVNKKLATPPSGVAEAALAAQRVRNTITRAAEQINAEGPEDCDTRDCQEYLDAACPGNPGGPCRMQSSAPHAEQTHVSVPQWMEEELKDGDRICAELGLERTEGGRLPMYKLLAKLRELKK